MTAPTELFAIGIDGSRSVYVRNSDGTWPALPTRIEIRTSCAGITAASLKIECDTIRAVTAEMRHFMPNACGDWANKIDDALFSIAINTDSKAITA